MSGPNPQQASANFGFLARHDPQLARLPALAELYCHRDPNTALLKLRQFIERLAQLTAAHHGFDAPGNLGALVHELGVRRVAHPDVIQSFHLVRSLGNQANHEMRGSPGDALHALKAARMLGAWYHRSFFERGFKPGPFTTPKPPADPAAALLERLAATRTELSAERQRIAGAEEKAALEEELRRAAEAEARAARGDLEAALELAEESEQQAQRYRARLTELRAAAEESTEQQRRQLAERTLEAAVVVDPDEAQTRRAIDVQLRQAGWEADSEELRHGRGARPQKGRNLAIAEWPTAHGPADYVLFRGLVPLAVVEAKRRRRNAASAIEQAKRYSRGYQPRPEEPSPGGPWQEYRIPFLFATNGRPFLRQLAEESGIWFHDARQPANHPRALEGWYTPAGLAELLRLDTEAADRQLEATPADYLPLWEHQRDAVRAVEDAVARGQRHILVAMATGTGKTRTAIGLLYRLIKAGRFRRALFMVDRSALGEQAGEAFKDVSIEANQSFADIYDVKQLGDIAPEADTRLQIATVQSLVRRILYSADDAPAGAPAPAAAALAVDTYDLIVVDECHRGYTLDRELSDAELTFRDERDYISKYRRVLDCFDAVKIGLTATPALHTTEIFGDPVYHYSYPQAVIDGYLVDHEPPVRIVTRLAEEGIHWEIGEEVAVYDSAWQQLKLFHTPDEIAIEVEGFNKKVITRSFNRAVCAELARHIDPSLPGKTLVFCVDDRHADMVVALLKEAFSERYGGLDDDAVKKITGAADRPLELIRHYKNERLPAVAVTVDLLTTGIDVPAIAHLVFIRRVKSRILYEQMVGRATRLCPDLYGRGEDKEVFQIFDAVGLYASLQDYTDMKPVAADPKIGFRDLIGDLQALDDGELRQTALGQVVARLQRKRRRIEEELADDFTAAAGMEVGALLERLRRASPAEAAELFRRRPRLLELLDRAFPRGGRKILVSEHPDEVLRVERGYGPGQSRPEDYLESFGRFVRENLNRIPALVVVTQRPRDLTRQQLKELKLALDEEGYGELHLRAAWREWKNEDIAASIVGFIRQRALGEPLRPYAERVDGAVQGILAGREWTAVQRRWLERIGKQMKIEQVVDRAALDQGQFKSQGGGFTRFDRLFDGRMEEVLADLHEAVWKSA